ncbi:hypothetical protein RJT34_18303 [Clitoria ternatea]|uniref:Uncharacterized protein n=1 Tax=Clitoria ternatea TaxID=43366 RepID=A0AAN9JC24_CLITE
MMVEAKVGLARFEAARSSGPHLRTITASKRQEQAPVKLGRILQQVYFILEGPNFEAMVMVAWNQATITLSPVVKQEEFFNVVSKIVFGLDEKDRQLRYPPNWRVSACMSLITQTITGKMQMEY